MMDFYDCVKMNNENNFKKSHRLYPFFVMECNFIEKI